MSKSVKATETTGAKIQGVSCVLQARMTSDTPMERKWEEV